MYHDRAIQRPFKAFATSLSLSLPIMTSLSKKTRRKCFSPTQLRFIFLFQAATQKKIKFRCFAVRGEPYVYVVVFTCRKRNTHHASSIAVSPGWLERRRGGRGETFLSPSFQQPGARQKWFCFAASRQTGTEKYVFPLDKMGKLEEEESRLKRPNNEGFKRGLLASYRVQRPLSLSLGEPFSQSTTEIISRNRLFKSVYTHYGNAI